MFLKDRTYEDWLHFVIRCTYLYIFYDKRDNHANRLHMLTHSRKQNRNIHKRNMRVLKNQKLHLSPSSLHGGSHKCKP